MSLTQGVRTGLGCTNRALFCRDHLSPWRDDGALCGLYSQLGLGIAQSKFKVRSRFEVVEAVSVHIYTANIVMP